MNSKFNVNANVFDARNDYLRLSSKAFALSLVYSSLILVVKNYASQINENEFWNYFLSIAIFYQCISLSFEGFLVSNANWVYARLGRKAKEMYPTISDFAIATNNEFTSLVHSTISGISALFILCLVPSIQKDHLFGSSFYSSLHSVHSSALFFAEFLDLLIRPRRISAFDAVILVHHALATLGFFTGSFGIGTFYSTCILLSEISTMFLDLRWFLLRFDSQYLCKCAEFMFVTSFLCIRVGFNLFYLTPLVFQDLLPIALGSSFTIDTSRFPLYDPSANVSIHYVRGLAVMVCLLLCVFHLLNSFFLFQIFGMVKKGLEKSTKKVAIDNSNEESKPLLIATNSDEDE